jgi:hypothetical protein
MIPLTTDPLDTRLLAHNSAGQAKVRFSATDKRRDPGLAPKFYPVLSSPRLLDLPGWAVVAAGAGAEPSA